MIIRCTQKLLKELRIAPHEPAVVNEIGSWHANLLLIERRKCVLFTHDMSLFSVLVVGLKRDDFVHMDELFGQALFRTLRLCEFGQAQIERMLDWSRHNVYAKSNNRSVLGSMNDLMFQIEHRIEADGGLAATDLDDLRIDINRIPFKAIGYGYPRRRLEALLTGAVALGGLMGRAEGRRRRMVVVLTLFAMVAFAANSVFARLALEKPDIDAAGFTAVRLVSGALMLLLILSVTGRPQGVLARGNWVCAGMLFTYAAAFSFAYLSLDTGTGALILFATVQLTMILAALSAGERPRRVEWLGLGVAMGGLIYLVAPGLEAPSPAGAVLMALAGIAWGGYSLRGRGSADPVAETAGNFLRSIPLALLLGATALTGLRLSAEGVLWAVASGAFASALGYALWYAALPHLSATRAATVQLSVPVIAADGGVLFLAEVVTFRLVVASVLILGGIGLAVSARRK